MRVMIQKETMTIAADKIVESSYCPAVVQEAMRRKVIGRGG